MAWQLPTSFPKKSTVRFVLLGEKSKVVPVSVHRFAAFEHTTNVYGDVDIRVQLRGDPGEALAIEVVRTPAHYSSLASAFPRRGRGGFGTCCSQVASSIGGGAYIVHALGCTIGPDGRNSMLLIEFT